MNKTKPWAECVPIAQKAIASLRELIAIADNELELTEKGDHQIQFIVTDIKNDMLLMEMQLTQTLKKLGTPRPATPEEYDDIPF